MQIGKETKTVKVPVRQPQKAPEAIPVKDWPTKPAEKPVKVDNWPVKVDTEVTGG